MGKVSIFADVLSC